MTHYQALRDSFVFGRYHYAGNIYELSGPVDAALFAPLHPATARSKGARQNRKGPREAAFSAGEAAFSASDALSAGEAAFSAGDAPFSAGDAALAEASVTVADNTPPNPAGESVTEAQLSVMKRAARPKTAKR